MLISGYGSEKLVQFVSFDRSAESGFGDSAPESYSDDSLDRDSLLPDVRNLGSQTDDLTGDCRQVVTVAHNQS